MATGTGSGGVVTDLNDLHLKMGDPAFLAKMKSDPQATVGDIIQQTPLQTDPVIYRIVVSSLGLAVVATVIGQFVMAAMNHPMPDGSSNIGLVAVGLLGGLLGKQLVPGGTK